MKTATGKFRKGQIFSLDFIIAMAIVALAIGLLLSFYQTTAAQEKEARTQNELNIIALNASNLLLEKNRCEPEGAVGGATDFADQGYKLFGCLDGSKFTATPSTKSGLMIPYGFKCYITSSGNFVNVANCESTDASANVQDIAAIDRNFMGHVGSISKAEYEKCIAGTAGCTLQPGILGVKVWKA